MEIADATYTIEQSKVNVCRSKTTRLDGLFCRALQKEVEDKACSSVVEQKYPIFIDMLWYIEAITGSTDAGVSADQASKEMS